MFRTADFPQSIADGLGFRIASGGFRRGTVARTVGFLCPPALTRFLDG
ncbi:MAG: hypothetical protein ACF8NJ_04520 [Phycisphaerales bacterium JB038]